ncbi:hypothetical protein, partial [Bacteroides cellulosilyticus]|uniref:hypothetical protein n=1 Tax=Bacteroides cellulosilyticus TaxID=246787 RepID=UPI0032EC2AB8
LLKTVKGFCCLMQEIKNGIDRTHLKYICKRKINNYEDQIYFMPIIFMLIYHISWTRRENVHG